mmetsp:Transcript_10634/g.31425  ORF Transcript_10634/g.31425 Transcript_10634/m.31425 type:complete len:247 (+) Transcript_10634:3692-4432(+)
MQSPARFDAPTVPEMIDAAIIRLARGAFERRRRTIPSLSPRGGGGGTIFGQALLGAHLADDQIGGIPSGFAASRISVVIHAARAAEASVAQERIIPFLVQKAVPVRIVHLVRASSLETNLPVLVTGGAIVCGISSSSSPFVAAGRTGEEIVVVGAPPVGTAQGLSVLLPHPARVRFARVTREGIGRTLEAILVRVGRLKGARPQVRDLCGRDGADPGVGSAEMGLGRDGGRGGKGGVFGRPPLGTA